MGTTIWLPPVLALVISFFTSMAGISGVFLLLPLQVRSRKKRSVIFSQEALAGAQPHQGFITDAQLQKFKKACNMMKIAA